MIKNDYLEIINEYQQDIPINVARLSNALGIKVYKSSMNGISGAIIKQEDNSYAIYINSSDVITRQRFTAAHEIAHFLLHRDKIGNNITDNAMYRSRLSNVLERQANRLASEILMPKKYVNQFIKEDKSIFEMSNLFNVSEDAMRIRLEEGGDIFLEDKNFKLINLAKIIINICNDNNLLENIGDELKLEKVQYLLYFIFGKYLKATNNLLFDELPVCMYANPVFLTIENEYRSGNLTFNQKYDKNISDIKDKNLVNIIKEVLKTYGRCGVSALPDFKKSSFWFRQGNIVNAVPIDVIKQEFGV